MQNWIVILYCNENKI